VTVPSAVLAAALTAAAVTLSSCATSPPTVLRVDVAVHLTPDGQADVYESIAVRVDAPTTFERVVRPNRAESLAFGGAWIDGAPMTAGDGDAGPALRVNWSLDEPGDRVRTLELRYRASGVLALHGRRGALAWSALPVPRGYSIGAARIVLTVPAGAVRVGEWGLAEPDWTVIDLPDGIAATRTGLSPGDTATLLAEVAVDPAGMVEPRWQHDAEFGRQLIPAFIAGGLFILVIGVGVIGIIWFERASLSRDRRWPQPLPPQTASGLYTAGIVCLIFGSIVAGIVYVWIGRYGAWALAIPISILLVGLLFVLVGKRSDGGADLQVGPP
jgi:hypothetical protein